MLWSHPDHPDHRVRLGYCLNLRAALDLDGLLESLRSMILPLRDRLAPEGTFGVGMYVPALLAGHLVSEEGAGDQESLRTFLDSERLDAFTWNAFPYGEFQTDGLKEGVYEPTWTDARRARYTLDVARLAQALCRAEAGRSHLSVSTHGGRYGEWEGSEAEQARGQLREVLEFLESGEGTPVVLSVEAEPFSSATDTRAAAAWVGGLRSERLGLCLDCCHSAVEFEDAEETLAFCQAAGLGKVQFSSALRLEDPGANADGVAALLALDEPRFLHQVLSPDEGCRASDLPDLAAALEGDERWLAQDEWRCHFHVPVDLERMGGLGTTSAHADRLVSALLRDPGTWTRRELHLEIETYTWSVLPDPPSDPASLVDALEREYRHVFDLLSDAGWLQA